MNTQITITITEQPSKFDLVEILGITAATLVTLSVLAMMTIVVIINH